MRSTTFKIAALAAATTLTLAACGGGESTDSGSGGGDDAGASEEAGGDEGGDMITIGIKYDQPGLGLNTDGNPTGMDVDVAKAVAEGLGYTEDQIEWTEAISSAREDLLESNQVDMIVATYSITDERKERVQFAGPYFVAGQDLLVPVDSDIQGPDSMGDAILCSVTGSTSAERVRDEYGVALQEYGSYSECMEAMASGQIGALTTDDTILAGFAAQDEYSGQFKVVGNTFSEENYGVGLNMESDNCEEINEILQGLWDDGTMEQIIEDNLGAADYTPNADLNPPAEIGGNCA
ncbi:glutamate-binding protein of ABC transporter system [Serinicoccus hydrothermalis]|uniref:Glutamate-binding protein of ABC transporter system n=1 Tax=Serinicoccus hydrothermalis TaxID=1758689 RepID=A0A1B1N7W3_9MICO|nr:glutamate ABC transporter substrate-binding protein [Serinicoccus hydrothermalis]ANS77504.1 glutamate-binding protein of ABC transporter system [Serinicoccus hydrothermalis]